MARGIESKKPAATCKSREEEAVVPVSGTVGDATEHDDDAAEAESEAGEEAVAEDEAADGEEAAEEVEAAAEEAPQS